MTTQKNITANSPTYRFRHITPDGEIYAGEAEIEDDSPIGYRLPGEVTILSCWNFGLTINEVFPYEIEFPVRLRKAIVQTILEQRQCPPASPVELPTDWEKIEVVDVSTRYTIRTDIDLPTVTKPYTRKLYGLNIIETIYPDGLGNYLVIAKGGINDVRSEMQRLSTL